MTGLKVGLFILLIIIAAAVTYLQLRPAAEGDRACNPPGESPCGDKWINYAGAGPKRDCLPTYTWATDGYGPQSCKVDCPAGFFPCWDDNKQQGECRRGMTKDAACFTKCSATSCQNGGTCDLTSGICNCPSGFTGINCEKPIADTCVGKPAGYCGNGKCNPDQGVCVCIPGWYGAKCDNPGKCDLSICRAVDKGAYCADPNGPNPGDCVCSPGHGPSNGASACNTCLSGYGPAVGTNPFIPYASTRVAACSQRMDYHTAATGAQTLFSLQGGAEGDDREYWCFGGGHSQDTLTARCQAAFGPSSTSNDDRCHSDDACSGSGVGRPLCNVPAYYTAVGANPNDGTYAACNLNGPDRGGRNTTMLPPGFLPAV